MTFLSPWFLIGSMLVALPIIIHLWFKKRLRKIQFSSLTFLKMSEAKRFGWLRLREILTLISRCLFIACLVLSLARPRLQRAIFGTSRTASVALLIDNSYSMYYRDNFSQAKIKALEVIDRYSDQSQFMVLPMCQSSQDNTPFWANKRSVSSLIETLSLSYKTGSVFDALSSDQWKDARYDVERIYLGDGQAVAFVDYPDTMPLLYWIRLSAEENAGISDVSLADPIALPEKTYGVIVTVQNHSHSPWQGNIAIQESAYVQEIPCTIAPRSGRKIPVTLPHTLTHGTFHLETDSLDPDNKYYFSFWIPREIRILIVGDNPFIQKALQTGDVIRTPFNVTNTDRLGTTDARLFDIIIICGNVVITSADRSMLEHILREQTSGILFLLGKSIDPQLVMFLAPYCTVSDYIDPSGYVTIDWINYENSLFSIFRDESSLKAAKIYNYWSLTSKSGILARLTDDHPLIISKNNLTIISTDLVPSSTDIVYKTAFIPLLYRLIMSSVQPDYDLNQYVGSVNQLIDPVRSPTGEILHYQSEFTIPGQYTTGDTIISINVIAEEGDIKPLGSDVARSLNITPIKADDLIGKDLSLFFLICALAFLLFEVLLLLLR